MVLTIKGKTYNFAQLFMFFTIDSEKTGARAVMRFIGYHELEDNRVVYCAEIVPLKGVLNNQMALVTEEYLHRLSPILKNFWMSHYNHKRKKGKKR